jgi:hypothetical protein
MTRTSNQSSDWWRIGNISHVLQTRFATRTCSILWYCTIAQSLCKYVIIDQNSNNYGDVKLEQHLMHHVSKDVIRTLLRAPILFIIHLACLLGQLLIKFDIVAGRELVLGHGANQQGITWWAEVCVAIRNTLRRAATSKYKAFCDCTVKM